MAQDLARGRALDDAPGAIGLTTGLRNEYPPLSDDIALDPNAGRLDPRAWFADPSRPLEIEIGSGKGTFLLEQSSATPQVNYLGVEWAREYYMYTADRLRRAGRKNTRMLHADGGDFLRWRCPDACVRVVHLYFSDPWPKSKHHKNRVVQHRFLREAWRVLADGGELRVVTDHDELWAWDTAHFVSWTDMPPGVANDAATFAGASPTIPGVGAALEGLPRVPFAFAAFEPPAWVGEGCVIGTNYEIKMCVAAGNKPPHACVLRKNPA